MLTRDAYRINAGQIEPFIYQLELHPRGTGVDIEGWLLPGDDKSARDQLQRDVNMLVRASSLVLPGRIQIWLPDACDSPGLALLLVVELCNLCTPQSDQRVGWGAVGGPTRQDLVPARGAAALGAYLAARGLPLVVPASTSTDDLALLTSETGLSLYETPGAWWLREHHRISTSMACPYASEQPRHVDLTEGRLPPALVCVAIELAAAFDVAVLLYLPLWEIGPWQLFARSIMPPLPPARARQLGLVHRAVGALRPLTCRAPVRAPAVRVKLGSWLGTREQAGELALVHGGLLLLDAFSDREQPSIDAVMLALETRSVWPAAGHGVPVPARFGVVALEHPCGCLRADMGCLCNAEQLAWRRYATARFKPIAWVASTQLDDGVDHGVEAARERVAALRSEQHGAEPLPMLLRKLYGDDYPHAKVANALACPPELR